MASQKQLLTTLFAALMLVALTAGFAFAQEATPAPALPDTPAEPDVLRVSPVSVVHDDVDNVGTRLVFQLKEQLNTSSLFRLSAGDEKKIKLIIKTQQEFPGRPEIGSVYSVVWIFSASENVLTHYLASEAGVVTAANVAATAEALAGRTDAVAAQYAYLFE